MAPSETEEEIASDHDVSDGSVYSDGEQDEESGYYRLMSHDSKCGALFFRKKTGTKQLVCMNLLGACRRGHGDAQRAKEGYYRQTQTHKNPDKFDGVARDYLNETEYQAFEENRKKLNEALLATVARKLCHQESGPTKRRPKRDPKTNREQKGAGDLTGPAVGWSEDEIVFYAYFCCIQHQI